MVQTHRDCQVGTERVPKDGALERQAQEEREHRVVRGEHHNEEQRD